MRKILVPVRGDGMVDTVVGHAAALARRHGSNVVVAHCRTRTEDMIPYGVPLPTFARTTLMEQAREMADQQEQLLRDELKTLAARFDLKDTDVIVDGQATISFVEDYGLMADVIKRHGRLADLVVVAKPDRDRNLGANSLKSALFRTGRPVLMCPPGTPAADDFGGRITIAWNGSLEAARAVAMTLDLAKAADHVTILSGGESGEQGASASDLAAYYALHGITSDIHPFSGRNPGEILLSKTVDVGANLLIMGAYGQNHERETLFGGNTQTVVDEAEIPVVLVH